MQEEPDVHVYVEYWASGSELEVRVHAFKAGSTSDIWLWAILCCPTIPNDSQTQNHLKD